ncbi:MAG: hypothetical protein JW860_01015 [Sedimentisphaerales bacterium]|nr:hypothetical protein [Sedimentisphaerales bacterium]
MLTLETLETRCLLSSISILYNNNPVDIIEFPDTGVGYSTQADFNLTVLNTSGYATTTVKITDIQFADDTFSFSPTNLNPIPIGNYVNETPVPLTPEGVTLENTIGSNTDWYSLDVDFGTEVTFSFDTLSTTLWTDIYRSDGLELQSAYGAYGYGDEEDNPPLTLTFWETGTYYFSLRNHTPQEPNDYSLTVTRTGSVFEEFVRGEDNAKQIPIWFNPMVAGPKEPKNYLLTSSITIMTDAGTYGTRDFIELRGHAIPGDMTVDSIQFPQEQYPPNIQSGKPLTISAQIANSGPGLILDPVNMQFYLSSDNTLDKSKDLLLSRTAGTPLYDPDIIWAEDTETYTATYSIPEVPMGDYYLFAVVDGENRIVELKDYNNTTSMSVSIDPYNTVILDSSGDPLDRFIRYNKTAIGQSEYHYVTVYNRGDVPITVNQITLADGSDFIRQTDPGIVILPQQERNIHVTFKPDSFGIYYNSQKQDTLFIGTDENALYTVNLSGIVTGPDLLVEENYGTINDDIIEFEPIRPDTITPWYDFTLINNGDQVLYVNDISLQNENTFFETSAYQQIQELMPGQQFTHQVRFDPQGKSGVFTDSIIIKSSDRYSQYLYKLDVSGLAIEPELTIVEDPSLDGEDDGSLDFGLHPFNFPFTTTIYLVNTADPQLAQAAGNSSASLLNIKPWILQSKDQVFSVLQNYPTEEIILAPGEQYPLEVQFLITADENTSDRDFTGKLHIPSDGGIVTINLIGSAALPQVEIISGGNIIDDPGKLTLDPALKNYHNPAPSSTEWFLIQNSNVEYTFTSDTHITVEGEGLSIISPLLNNGLADTALNVPGSKLAPNEAIRVDILFDATDLDPGLYNGILIINPGADNQTKLNIFTEVISPRAEIIDPATNLPTSHITFTGNTSIGEKTTETILISNLTGTADLVIEDWNSTDTQFNLNLMAPLTIPPGQSIPVEISYSPYVPTLGNTLTVPLSLSTNDLMAPDITLALTGECDGRPLIPDNPKKYTFRDGNDDLVKISLTQGSFELYLQNGQHDNADIYAIRLFDTTEKSKLKISTRGETTIGSINTVPQVDSQTVQSLSAIQAQGVTIETGIFIAGSLDKLLLGDVEAGAAVTVQNQNASFRPMTIKAEYISNNVNFNLNSPLNTLQAKSYTSGQLTAQNINKINISDGSLGAGLLALSGNIRQVRAQQNITGDIQAENSIGSITSSKGKLTGDIIALQGNLDKIQCASGLTGAILVQNSIGTVSVNNGSFTGTIRAQNLKEINANDFNQALISAANIGAVNIQSDIIDSFVLAGYDVGMSVDIRNYTDDSLNPGNIGKFEFGGDYRNSYVTCGVMTDSIYSLLYNLLPSGAEYSAGSGALSSGKGRTVHSDNDNMPFGFYSAGSIKLTIDNQNQPANFEILNNYNPSEQ